MKETIRLNIPTPCTEDWDKMLPEEQGRHCQQCCKTVVDFTGMSDAEVLRFFKERPEGAGVCGRFFTDQLKRELAPAPVQRNGAKGWQWVVASALVLGKGPEPGRPAKAAVEVRQVVDGGVVQLGPEAGTGVDTSAQMVPDTSYSEVTMGTPAVTVGDVKPSILPDTVLIGKMRVNDSVPEMPADTVTAAVIRKLRDRTLTGLVSIVSDTMLCTRKSMDTASRVKAVVDTVVDILKDTVAAVVPGWARAGTAETADPESRQLDMLNVYPNPVLRGGTMRLAWRGEAGIYEVTFLNLHGQITQARMIVVSGKGQVDEWVVPYGFAAGVYFLRVARLGEKVVTREILIQ